MWVTAIILGLAGSFHCLGMCSPLVMAVTSVNKTILLNRVIYNVGRVFTYAILGAMVSNVGSFLNLSSIQNVLSIVLGSILLLLGITGVSAIRIPFLTRVMTGITIHMKALFAKFLQKKTTLSIGFMGMLNGLLPCGLTYLALTYCIILPNAVSGFLFMLVFGIGTLPVMLGLTSIVQKAISYFKFSFAKATTIVMISLGILLLSRAFYSHHQRVDQVTKEEMVICR